LIATPEELKKLSMQYNDHTTGGEKIIVINLGEGIKQNETN